MRVWLAAVWLGWGVAAAQDTGSVTADGAVRIVVARQFKPLVERLDAEYARVHPGARFVLVEDPTGLLGLGGIAQGVSAFSLLGHAAYPAELRPYLQMRGSAPADAVIAGLGCRTARGMPLPGLYTNAALPEMRLSWDEAVSVLTRGGAGGDRTRWSQIGVRGAWAGHAIHVYGPPDDGGFVTGLRRSRLGGAELARRYEELSTSEAVAEAVRGDRWGIGLIEEWKGAAVPPGLRAVAVRSVAGGEPGTGSCAEVAAGRYGFAGELHLYSAAGEDGRPGEFVREWLRVAGSAAGRRILGSVGNGYGGVWMALK